MPEYKARSRTLKSQDLAELKTYFNSNVGSQLTVSMVGDDWRVIFYPLNEKGEFIKGSRPSYFLLKAAR